MTVSARLFSAAAVAHNISRTFSSSPVLRATVRARFDSSPADPFNGSI